MTKDLSAGARKRVEFQLTVGPGKAVFVAGTFNKWAPTANRMRHNPDSGHCKATLNVPKGRHEYKFIVNDVWALDPNCPEWVPNGCGSLNSVLHV